MKRFENKTVLITGGTRGIGKAIALRLAAEGANIAIVGKTAEPNPKLEGTIYTAAEEIVAAGGGKVLPLQGDIRFEDSIKDFVARTIPRLPNFTATRTTITYQRDLLHKEWWHAVGLSHALVFYRDGQETQRFSEFEIDPGLSTRGEFGPILSTVMLDITKDNFAWSRWENGEKGPLAVFQYEAEAGHSHYEVENRLSGYVGEITIDPADGSIVRLALKADMEPANPFLMADVMIEYGPEVLGDKTYICPKRGVALSQGLSQQWVNNVVFTSYHLFHATTRILPGAKPTE